MIKFVGGFVLGLIVASVGFAGIGHYADKGVTATTNVVKGVATGVSKSL
jgi:hypothetical protein